MIKIVIRFFTAMAAVASIIWLSGYSYLFKALILNLSKGGITPGIDDAEKFPYHIIRTKTKSPWKKSGFYNAGLLSKPLLKELKKSKASSLLVIRNGELAAEYYWKKHHEASLLNSFSMAKSIIALLVGCAIKDGFISSEKQLVSSIIPHYKNCKYGKKLTVEHLLSMQSGLDWDEEYNHPFAENSRQYFVDDLEKQIFKLKFKQDPGTEYEYQSASAQLLGIVLRKAVKRSLSQYLSEKIWQPLQMESDAKWSIDKKGLEKAFCCIHAISRDYAKIGQLLLQHGKWNGVQILPENYCKKLLQPTQLNDAFCYSIWTNRDHSLKHHFFYGFLGQFIIMIPEKNIVIVKTGFDRDLATDKKKRPLQVKILVDEICDFFDSK